MNFNDLKVGKLQRLSGLSVIVPISPPGPPDPKHQYTICDCSSKWVIPRYIGDYIIIGDPCNTSINEMLLNDK
jgi:hypothetical protein